MRADLPDLTVLDDAAARRSYDCDAYGVDRSPPDAVVLPETTEQVAQVVQWCVKHGKPFTARGAGTGLSGGALAALGGLIISTKKLTQVIEVNLEDRWLHAQAGIANIRLTKAVSDQGLHFAPDPSSQTVATLGGNIAENAGGPHTLKYGVTAPHILGCVMVSPEGEVLQFGPYPAGAPGIDPLTVIVGGEGTLGIVTEAWVKLTPLPSAVATLLIAFPTVEGATETVASIIGQGVIPAALEMMDWGIMGALKAAFNLEYPAEARALLLIELDSAGDVSTAFERVRSEQVVVERICREHGAISIQIAQNERERKELWRARKQGVGAMGRLAPSVVTHDGVIPRSKLPQMLDEVYKIAADHKVNVANIFHAGDGNLHPCFYFDDRDPDQIAAVVAAGEAVVDACLNLGGSVTGEHGIGVEKADLMTRMFTPEDLKFQADLKRAFNQTNLCNPCKILPNQKSCVEHKMRWRGVAW